MTSVVVVFAYPIKLNISTRRELQKFYERSCIVILTYLPNAVKKMLDKVSFHKHFNGLFNCSRLEFRHMYDFHWILTIINAYLPFRISVQVVQFMLVVFRYWRPGPENSYWRMTYKFFGFIFIQDMVDRGITEVQANETIDTMGMFLQLFPYPCYIYDRFVTMSLFSSSI